MQPSPDPIAPPEVSASLPSSPDDQPTIGQASDLGPTTNGQAASGTPTANGIHKPGRAANGRFLPANGLGIGRPSKAFMDWRAAFDAAISAEDVYRVSLRLKREAIAGTAWAIRDLLDRKLGKPEASVTVTNVGGQRQRADVLGDLAKLLSGLPEAQRVLIVARLGLVECRPGATDGSSVDDRPIVDAVAAEAIEPVDGSPAS